MVKTPVKARKETIMVEINHNDEHRDLMKRKGLFLKSTLELEKFNYAMDNKKLKELIEALENIFRCK